MQLVQICVGALLGINADQQASGVEGHPASVSEEKLTAREGTTVEMACL